MSIIKIPFCTPLYFQSSFQNSAYSSSLREKVLDVLERYFHIQSTQVFNIYPPQDIKVPLRRTGSFIKKSASSSVFVTVIKILSYLTVIIPLIALVAKFLLRSSYVFFEKEIVISSSDLSEEATSKESIKDLVSLFSDNKSLDIPMSSDVSDQASLQESEEVKTSFRPSSATPYEHLLKLPLLKKTVSSSPHSFKEEDMIACLTEFLDVIRQQKEDPSIRYLSKNMFLCFEFPKQFPGVIFKTYRTTLNTISQTTSSVLKTEEAATEKRYAETQKIGKYLQEQAYQHLYIPQSKLIKISVPQGYVCFMVEEKLSLYPDLDTDLVWKLQRKELQPAFIELALLIQGTGLHDIKPNNCSPFIKNDQWILALIDTEWVEKRERSDQMPKGIIELFGQLPSKSIMEAVLQVMPIEQKRSIEGQMKRRVEKLRQVCDHEQFHIKSGTHPYRPIKLQLLEKDIDQLEGCGGFSLNEQAVFPKNASISMREAIRKIINGLNEAQEKRRDQFSMNYHSIALFPSSLSSYSYEVAELSSSENEKDLSLLWSRKILTVLQQKGYIHSWDVIVSPRSPAADDGLLVLL